MTFDGISQSAHDALSSEEQALFQKVFGKLDPPQESVSLADVFIFRHIARREELPSHLEKQAGSIQRAVDFARG
tara:strand:+ start:149 stop:370 length:222 start_codon:yes stop_codon:yes gene_type:complete